MSDVIEKILPLDGEMTLANGDKVTIKSLSWGKEIKALQLVSKCMDESNVVDAINTLATAKEKDSISAIASLVMPLINSAPERITKIVSLLIDKDEKYVEESCTSEDVMQVFTPFLKVLFNKYTKMFQLISQG